MNRQKLERLLTDQNYLKKCPPEILEKQRAQLAFQRNRESALMVNVYRWLNGTLELHLEVVEEKNGYKVARKQFEFFYENKKTPDGNWYCEYEPGKICDPTYDWNKILKS